MTDTVRPAGPVDAVLLDAGGVLVLPDAQRIAAHLAADGLPVDPAQLREAHYRGVVAVDRAGSPPEDFAAYHRAYLAHVGFRGRRLAAALRALEQVWATPGLWCEPVAGAAEGLAAVAATGTPVVIVSNADGTVADVLASTGLLQMGPGPGVPVAAIVDSGAVGVAKPDPAIFEIALAAVGVPAHRAVHVGDAFHYDVRGARAAGIRPLLVDPLGLRDDVDCDRVAGVGDLPAVLGWDGSVSPGPAPGRR